MLSQRRAWTDVENLTVNGTPMDSPVQAPISPRTAPNCPARRTYAGSGVGMASAGLHSDRGGDFAILDAMTHSPIDIAEKLSQFSEPWSPKTVARLNDYEIKVVKLRGEFTWHTHQDTDELFLVTKGQLTIQMHEGNVTLEPGQLFVVPRGIEHCPITDGEVHAVLIEPTGVVNTGDAGGPMTAAQDDSLT
jgi:mannose-6-phosphate isomerase-like protein (cupin superfamily)